MKRCQLFSQSHTDLIIELENIMNWFRLAVLVGTAYLCLGCWPVPKVDQTDFCYADIGMIFVSYYHDNLSFYHRILKYKQHGPHFNHLKNIVNDILNFSHQSICLYLLNVMRYQLLK